MEVQESWTSFHSNSQVLWFQHYCSKFHLKPWNSISPAVGVHSASIRTSIPNTTIYNDLHWNLHLLRATFPKSVRAHISRIAREPACGERLRLGAGMTTGHDRHASKIELRYKNNHETFRKNIKTLRENHLWVTFRIFNLLAKFLFKRQAKTCAKDSKSFAEIQADWALWDRYLPNLWRFRCFALVNLVNGDPWKHSTNVEALARQKAQAWATKHLKHSKRFMKFRSPPELGLSLESLSHPTYHAVF